MSEKKNNLTEWIQKEEEISTKEKIALVWHLSVPTIIAQLTQILMQYIDAAMVGSLGAEASASIGLVASSTWLVGGLLMACAAGFSVQAAQAIGAGDHDGAKHIFRQGIIVCLIWSGLWTLISMLVSRHLAQWLGAVPEVWHDANSYAFIFACSVMISQMNSLGQQMLQSSGDMKTPSRMSMVACAADVVFNYFLIFPTRSIFVFGRKTVMIGAGLGVTGAAWGTLLATLVSAVFMIDAAVRKSPVLNLKQKGSWRLNKETLQKAWSIGFPMGMEQSLQCAAQVMSTRIVAPLGTTAIAANSFAVTAESICYMPGYGIGSAATVMVGQAIGAKRKDLANSFAWYTTILGMVMMSATGVAMYILCPHVFAFLTPDPEVQVLGARVLRIELHAEPLFAASIVACAAMRGAGDTFIPGIINLISIWGVRIILASQWSKAMGLPGVWYAMCLDLSFRGILFLIRLKRKRWLEG